MDTLQEFRNIQDTIKENETIIEARFQKMPKIPMSVSIAAMSFASVIIFLSTPMGAFYLFMLGLAVVAFFCLFIFVFECFIEKETIEIRNLELDRMELMETLIEEHSDSTILKNHDFLVLDHFMSMVLTANGTAYEAYVKVSSNGDVQAKPLSMASN